MAHLLRGFLRTAVSARIVRRRLRAADDRRHRYPFTSCTQCGPRYSVIRAMPFERADTTMAEFALCPIVATNTSGRAIGGFTRKQPRARVCGPHIWATCRKRQRETVAMKMRLKVAVANLSAGKIVAAARPRRLPAFGRCDERSGCRTTARAQGSPREAAGRDGGIGRGCAPAGSHRPERDLRRSKIRPAPIVLLRSHSKNGLAPAIHPHLDTVGLMRPTTPLHAILVRDFGRPLVCTSANREGDPLQFRERSGGKAFGRDRRSVAASQSGDCSAN